LRLEGWLKATGTLALVVTMASGPAYADTQEPAPPAPSENPPKVSAAAPASKSGKKKYSHANDFLIMGTVFNEKALSFPGVELQLRRAGEKKFRWESFTNSRGEFAIRVPQGTDYEMVVRAKGFTEQTRTIDAKNGDYQGEIVFRMVPEGETKK